MTLPMAQSISNLRSKIKEKRVKIMIKEKRRKRDKIPDKSKSEKK